MSAETVVAAQIPNARWWRIIPPTIIIYIIAYMDRMNISFAMAGGMNKDLGLSMAGSGLVAGIFFWGYLVLQAPAGHIAEHGSAKKFILWTIIAWGGLSVLTGFVQNSWQMLVMRFLLGVAEGGVYPALLIVVGKWFPKRELGRANALFLMSLPLSTVITNPVSGWIVANHSWRWLFIYEGAVSLLLIFIWMPMISDRPEEAKWISKEEKEYLMTTLAREKAEAQADYEAKAGQQAKLSYKELLANKHLWLMVLVYMCYTTGQYGYTLWLPTLLRKLTKMSLTNVGWLTSLPFVMALAGLYMMGAFSDKTGNRRLYTSLSLLGFGVIFWLATLFPAHIWVCFGLLVLTGLFTKSMQSPFWAMPAVVFPPGVAGAARGVINAVGNLGGFFGPVMVGWFTTKTGNMNYGIYSLSVVLCFGAAITMLLPKATAGFQAKAATKTVPLTVKA